MTYFGYISEFNVDYHFVNRNKVTEDFKGKPKAILPA